MATGTARPRPPWRLRAAAAIAKTGPFRRLRWGLGRLRSDSRAIQDLLHSASPVGVRGSCLGLNKLGAAVLLLIWPRPAEISDLRARVDV